MCTPELLISIMQWTATQRELPNLGCGKEGIKISVFQVEGRRNNRAKLPDINYTVRARPATASRVEP